MADTPDTPDTPDAPDTPPTDRADATDTTADATDTTAAATTSAAPPPVSGVQFPADPSGTRSTGSLAKEVVSEALAAIDPAARQRVLAITNWRKAYIAPFVEMVACGVRSDDQYKRVCATALEALQSRMVAVVDGTEIPMRDYLATVPPAFVPATQELVGTAAAVPELRIPVGGQELAGPALAGQIERWRAAGVLEPSAAEALLAVQAHPEWLRLPGREMVVLGLGSEMGPATKLLEWGATVLGVDLPTSKVWDRLDPATFAGTLRFPLVDGMPGLDLLHQLPEARAWIAAAASAPATLGTYVYADGGTHVRLSSASDALAAALMDDGTANALAYLSTPMDVFIVPGDVREESNARFARQSRLRDVRGLLGRLTMGRGFARNYPVGAGPAVHDALVSQQGPNYTLAKRVQRWRAVAELDKGRTVSINVAPATRTASVMKNKALAAVYDGADRFAIEVFHPDTSEALLAALLAYDLNNPVPQVEHFWQYESLGAATGGLWRNPYLPRTALPAAAAVGLARRAGKRRSH